MDIDLLSKMVKELILDNDRVVLPGLGSFVAEIVPSTFSDKGYTINPPYRRLYFRSKPDEGNELAAFYAVRNNVEVRLSERIVFDFVKELKELLHLKKTVVFPGLGRLRATKENNVFFVADEDLDIYPAGFGLEPVSLKTHQETKEEVTAAVEELKAYLEVPAQDPISDPIPDSAPESTSDSVSEPVPEMLPDAVQEQPLTQEDIAEAPEDTEEVHEIQTSRNIFKKIVIVMALVVVLLLVALAVVGRLCPEFVDTFLYTPEELKILNHVL